MDLNELVEELIRQGELSTEEAKIQQKYGNYSGMDYYQGRATGFFFSSSLLKAALVKKEG